MTWDDVVNFVSGVGDTVATGAKAAGDGVETGFNAVADATADVVETLGNGIQDGLNAIGELVAGIPVIGGFLSGSLAWLGGIVAGVTNLAGAIIKGTYIIGGVIGGLIKILGGILTLNGALILDGLIDIGATILGGAISIGGTALSLLQRIVPFINNDRALTKDEKSMLATVFQRSSRKGNRVTTAMSLSLFNIRIKFTSGIPTTHFTLNNTIYSPIQDLVVPPEVLVHECVHVWQYQNLGPRYLAEALGAQLIYGTADEGGAYDWTAELDRGNTEWENFNREAQASLIHEIWDDGTLTSLGTTKEGSGAFYEKDSCEAGLAFVIGVPTLSASCVEEFARGGIDHTPLAIESVAKLREPWNFRLSQMA